MTSPSLLIYEVIGMEFYPKNNNRHEGNYLLPNYLEPYFTEDSNLNFMFVRSCYLSRVLIQGELLQEHYKDLKAKSFYEKLIDYITSGPVVCMVRIKNHLLLQLFQRVLHWGEHNFGLPFNAF